jgi:alcohol dehydrogenase class IV
VLLVTGGKSYTACGAQKLLEPRLQGRNFTRVSVCQSNPDKAAIDHHLATLGSISDHSIVAVGGGSVIDTAKLLKAFSKNEKPLTAIPTTAGSGSESTHFAAYSVDGEKQAPADTTLLPDACFLCPELLKSMSPKQRACSGLDALCQGIESYWSIQSTDQSRSYAAEAIQILWPALHLDASKETAAQLSIGSNQAGRAINISRTTAAHALSYTLTAQHGIPHGHAVALMLPGVFRANSRVIADNCADTRGPDFVQNRIGELTSFLGETTPDAAAAAFTNLIDFLGLETSLSQLGINPISTIRFDSSGSRERMANNPRCLTPEAISAILLQP